MKRPFILFAFALFAMVFVFTEPGADPVHSVASPVFQFAGSIKISSEGAAEIVAYSTLTKMLFAVNNAGIPEVTVIDASNPQAMKITGHIPVTPYGGCVNSVAVKGNFLAMAVEAKNKQENGSIVVYNAQTLREVAVVKAGALPDMVAWSPDGRFLLSANEGEPSDDYKNDPEGTITVIDTRKGWNGVTIGFESFASQVDSLKKSGFRIFGPGSSFTQDIEPEYIAVRADSKSAYVSLQENNAFAVIDLEKPQVTAIYPFGFKDHSLAQNSLDPSDKDGGIKFGTWPVKGMYLPDGIAVVTIGARTYLLTANEGDSRDYKGFSEETRVKDLRLDPVAFPNAAALQAADKLGRLKTTTTMGDIDSDGLYEEIYSFGARSFTVWDAQTGALVFDSGDFIGKKTAELRPDLFNQDSGAADGRSDDKGAEPESITTGIVRGKLLIFVALERTGGILVFQADDVSNPEFLTMLFRDGDVSPEGLLFVPAEESHLKKAMLIVGNEVSGTVSIYTIE